MKNVRSAYVLSKTLLTDFIWYLGFITDCYVYKYTVRVMGKNIKSIWLFSWVLKYPAMKLVDRYSLQQHWGLVWSLLSCKWSEVTSEKFGSRKSSSMKEGHLSYYYTIVKSEVIYVYEG